MTVGKIYVGLIIAENWRAYKSSQSKMNNLKMVSFKGYCIFVQTKKKCFVGKTVHCCWCWKLWRNWWLCSANFLNSTFIYRLKIKRRLVTMETLQVPTLTQILQPLLSNTLLIVVQFFVDACYWRQIQSNEGWELLPGHSN